MINFGGVWPQRGCENQGWVYYAYPESMLEQTPVLESLYGKKSKNTAQQEENLIWKV